MHTLYDLTRIPAFTQTHLWGKGWRELNILKLMLAEYLYTDRRWGPMISAINSVTEQI